jgi:hypothetical protein
MLSKRTAIWSLAEKIREVNADSDYPNEFLYNSLLEQARWLIKRETSRERIYSNDSVFQTLKCMKVIEASTIDECCPIKTNCKIYRTEHRLPDMWIENSGPIIRSITSLDRSTHFTLISSNVIEIKQNDPYQKMKAIKYAFFSDGYLWFPDFNPRFVRVTAFFVDDLALYQNPCLECADINDECIAFLDTQFIIPEWVEAEMYAKAVQLLAGSKQIPEDEQIDKNNNRKS